MVSAAILEKATKTDCPRYDTGLRLRGFEVHAIPPHRYSHCTEFFILHPQEFETKTYQDGEFCGRPRWVVGFTRPDGKRQVVYASYKTREEAEHARQTYPGATAVRLSYQLVVGYKRGNEWTTKDLGSPWGIIWAEDQSYQPMRFQLTEEEAVAVLAFQEEVDTKWREASSEFLRRETDRLDAVAHAAATDGVLASVWNLTKGPTGCLECGASFEEPGHVHPDGMGCDRCG